MTKPEPQLDQKPIAAPCRQLNTRAPFRWLALGWRDYKNSQRVSLMYGLLICLISIVVSVLAWFLGRYLLLLAMLTGFVFIAPLLATGLYSVSRQLVRDETPLLRRTLLRMRVAMRDALVFALVLLVIFLVWVRAASMVHVFFPVNTDQGWSTMLLFLGIGTSVGAVFALISFSAAAFSLPMIVDRKVDMITATVTSINAVLRNKYTMLVWLALIIGLTAIGLLTFGLGLVIVVPLLGYATYHGYLEAIDAAAWELSDDTEKP